MDTETMQSWRGCYRRRDQGRRCRMSGAVCARGAVEHTLGVDSPKSWLCRRTKSPSPSFSSSTSIQPPVHQCALEATCTFSISQEHHLDHHHGQPTQYRCPGIEAETCVSDVLFWAVLLWLAWISAFRAHFLRSTLTSRSSFSSLVDDAQPPSSNSSSTTFHLQATTF